MKHDEPGLQKEPHTVLVVDDEQVIRNLTRNILIREGFEVILAESGLQACKTFEQKRAQIDLVLLDMIMPDMDGKETYKRLRTILPDVRVVFSTGYSMNDPRLHVSSDEKTGFVQKPYSIDILISEVKRVLNL